MQKSNQKGNTMLEAMAAIAITGVLAVAALKLVGSLFDLFKQNMVVSEIRELQKNISSRYALEGNYKPLETATVKELVDERIIPNKMISGKGSENPKIYHSLAGEVKIKASEMADYYYEVTFESLSMRGCINLSQVNWSTSQNSGLAKLTVNGFDFELPIAGKGPKDEDTLPVTMDKAVKRCKSGKNNTVTWTFL